MVLQMLPSVSVVIPMRNEAKILKRCLHAIEKLDYPEKLLEVVIVNDGSTDNTKDIILNTKWSFNYQYIETEGVGGFKSPRNRIQESQGRFHSLHRRRLCGGERLDKKAPRTI